MSLFKQLKQEYIDKKGHDQWSKKHVVIFEQAVYRDLVDAEPKTKQVLLKLLERV